MPTLVSFNAGCSEGDINTYTWDFGDGQTGNGATTNHQYGAGTSWTATLTVAGPTGTSVTIATVTLGGNSGSSIGTPVSSSPQVGDNPQVMLRISNDAGKTWISEQWRSAGKMGEYWKRIRWNGLGSARRRVFEVVVTDPVPWRLVGADLQISQSGPSGQPRNS